MTPRKESEAVPEEFAELGNCPSVFIAGEEFHAQNSWRDACENVNQSHRRAVKDAVRRSRVSDKEDIEAFISKRIVEWIKSSPRKQAVVSFTEGPLRQIAYAVEDMMREERKDGGVEVGGRAEAVSGHGHVTPNKEGLRARCEGPPFCGVCSKELLSKMQTVPRKKVRMITEPHASYCRTVRRCLICGKGRKRK